MNVKEKAVSYHEHGYNCAQSVLAALSEYTGLDEKTALAVSAGFGGGLRCGEVCGAVSGAVMALSLAFPFTDSSDTGAKDRIAALAKDFCAAAKEQLGGLRCEDIKGDKSKCVDYVGSMAALAEKFIIM